MFMSFDLQNIVDQVDNLYQVKKADLHPGDKI